MYVLWKIEISKFCSGLPLKFWKFWCNLKFVSLMIV